MQPSFFPKCTHETEFSQKTFGASGKYIVVDQLVNLQGALKRRLRCAEVVFANGVASGLKVVFPREDSNL